MQERNLGSLTPLDNVRASAGCKAQGEAWARGELRIEVVWKRAAGCTGRKVQVGSTRGRGVAKQHG